MPELPEVETLAHDLQRLIKDSEFERVDILWDGAVAVPTAEELAGQLPGHTVLQVSRRGKYLVLSLSGGSCLLVHLRMSGRLEVQERVGPLDPHARIVFQLSDGRRLVFVNMRKFGRVYWTKDRESVLGDLGPEPLSDGFTPRALAEILGNHRGALKPLLLNQRVLSGLGNIYVDEALFVASLHPLRKSNSLSSTEVEHLHSAIRYVLGEAIRSRGTTLSDESFHDAEGQPGENAGNLRVYQRAGLACTRCGTPVRRTVVGGRGTHFCPSCQRAAHADSI